MGKDQKTEAMRMIGQDKLVCEDKAPTPDSVEEIISAIETQEREMKRLEESVRQHQKARSRLSDLHYALKAALRKRALET